VRIIGSENLGPTICSPTGSFAAVSPAARSPGAAPASDNQERRADPVDVLLAIQPPRPPRDVLFSGNGGTGRGSAWVRVVPALRGASRAVLGAACAPRAAISLMVSASPRADVAGELSPSSPMRSSRSK